MEDNRNHFDRNDLPSHEQPNETESLEVAAVESSASPELEVVVEAEADTEAEVVVEAETDTEPEPETVAATEVEPEAEASPEAEAEPEAEIETASPEETAVVDTPEQGATEETPAEESTEEAATEAVVEESDVAEGQAEETPEEAAEEATEAPAEIEETKVSPIVLPPEPEVATETEEAHEAQQPTPEAQDEAKETKAAKVKGFFKPWMAIVAALVLAAAGFGAYQAKLASDYSKAMDHFEQGSYQEAQQEFEALGDYKDAASYYDVASKWTAAQAKEKSALQNVDAWNEVAKDYDAIGSPEAKTEAERCRNTATYYQACQTLEENLDSKKNVQKALELFQNCNGVFDADAQIAYCKDDLTYLDATKLIKDKKWAEATEKLGSLSDSSFRDASQLRSECSYWTSYEEAASYYDAGQYYEAYQRFLSLGDADYEGADATERANACIQDFPAGGVVYRNDAYSSDDLQLTIDNSGLPNAYYKLYIGDDLVATIFIAAGGSETFMLPAGTYHMNKGYGETWFGTQDMFGDEGDYWKCTVGSSEYFDLEYGWAYEISSGGDGTGITTNSSDRSSI